MAYKYPKKLNQALQDMIENVLRTRNGFDVYIVTDINESTYTCNIKNPNFKTQVYNDVPILGLGLGNFKGGAMKLPEPNDFVLIGFLGANSETPIILGTLFDIFTGQGDVLPGVKRDELFLNNKSKGSYIIINQNNDVTVRTANDNGDISAGSKMKLGSDGSLKLFNKNGYGIEVDANGNMVIHCTTCDFNQSQGQF